MADPYATLGVKKDADAAAIKSAYRKLAKHYHPDRNKGDKKAADRFARISAAYDILSDKEKRGKYDRGEIDADGNPTAYAGFRPGGGGFQGGQPGGGFAGGAQGFEFQGDPSDLFSELFGRGRSGASRQGFGHGFRAPPARGADVAYRLQISLVDAALARSKRLTLSSGKTIDLQIPKAVEDGQQLRLAGQGEDGPGGKGDAIVTVHIRPDARFRREGDNLRTDIRVPLPVAVNGGVERVETPEGEVEMTIRPGTNSGVILRLKGKGWTRANGSRGDLLARVLVMLPDDLAPLRTLYGAGDGAQSRPA